MIDPRRMRLLLAALVALILVSACRAQDDTIDFGFYPKGAQDCMYKAANDSKCRSETVAATNSCLCRNGGNFITNAAACIGQSSAGDLEVVYRNMTEACGTSRTPISITEDEFMAAANAATSTTSTAGPTTTSSTSKSGTTTATDASTTSDTSTGTATSAAVPAEGQKEGEEEEGGGLKTGVMAGIIVGAVGAAVLLCALAFFLFRRRRKLGEESHPMLSQQGHPSVAGGHDSSAMHNSAYYSSPPSTAGWPKKDWQGPSPDLRSSGFNWESPAHLSYPSGGGPLAPSPPLPPQELDGAQYVAPTGSTQAPAEMPGETPAVATTPANARYRPYNTGQRYPAFG